MQAVPPQAFTYLHDDGVLYTYNISVAFPVAYNQGNLDVPDLTYAASSPESIASPRTPGPDVVSNSLPLLQTSKKSKSRRSKDPNHVGRPLNSFMLFRSEQNALVQKAGNAYKINQQEISRNAAELWRNLSSEAKQRYADAAAEQNRKQREYRESHPDSKPSKKRDSTSIKRARAQKPYDRLQKRVNAKNDDVVPLETVSSPTVVPGPSPEQWLGPQRPQPSQFINPMLTQCIPTNVVDRTDPTAANTQFDLRLDSIYNWQSPMPPSIDITTQLPALPPTEQQNQSFDLSALNDNWLLPNETTSILDTSASLWDHNPQLFVNQFLNDLEALQKP